MASLIIISFKDKDSSLLKVVSFIKVIFQMVNIKVMAQSSILIRIDMKESFFKANMMEKVNLNGLMGQKCLGYTKMVKGLIMPNFSILNKVK